MNKITNDGYILAISTANTDEVITETEYNEILSTIKTAPIAPDGYVYKLRSDNLEWVLVENEDIDEDADGEDFINALSEVGVLSSD